MKANGISSVDWGPGQGNIPGKENDWNVAVWFDKGCVVFDGIHKGRGIYIVGPSGHKAGREAFGEGFIEFLTTNHVQLRLPPRDLLGQQAEVVAALHPLGQIRVGQNEYAARPLGRMIDKGSTVAVEDIRGTSTYVRQKNRPNKASEVTARKLAEPQG